VSAVPLWQRRRAGLTFTRLDLSIDGSSIRFTLKNWVYQGRLNKSANLNLFTYAWQFVSIFAAFGFQIFYVVKRKIFIKRVFLKSVFIAALLTFIVPVFTQFWFNVLDIFPTNKLACAPHKFANFADASSCMIELGLARLDVDISVWLYPIIVLEVFLIISALIKNRLKRNS
jgi:hypothetical protein